MITDHEVIQSLQSGTIKLKYLGVASFQGVNPIEIGVQREGGWVGAGFNNKGVPLLLIRTANLKIEEVVENMMCI